MARALYFMGWKIPQIAEHLQMNQFTLYDWRKTEGWDSWPMLRRAEDTTLYRYHQLLLMENKSNAHFKELDALGRQMERFARIGNYEQSGKEADLNPKRRTPGPKPERRNFLSPEHVALLREALNDGLFGYQATWQSQMGQRIRNILKSRQIGATWYFAREALHRAIVDGDPSIFLSASKSQAQVFRSYIINFVREVCDVDLAGGMDRPLTIRMDGAAVDLLFLGTNARTAQSYHGHVYMDEYFWIPGFITFNKVASGMAMHKRWTKTYISTPSAVTHEAFPFWTGEHFNRGRDAGDLISLDVSHKALRSGRVDPDGQWRHMVTIEDALSAGCDLFDIDELRREYSPEEFRNLLMCEFIDDKQSIFPLALLQPVMVDSWELWDDIKPFSTRPYGNKPVWVGYDPAPSSDSASVIVVAPPEGKRRARVIEKHSWRSMPYTAQADQIKGITQRYNVTHIAVDKTGVGEGVFQDVKKFFPRVKGLHYSPEIKSRLVMRLLGMLHRCEIEWDSGWSDLSAALMSVRQTMTESGKYVTYRSGRDSTGHADLAWALMHALEPMPTTGANGAKKSSLEIF
jgi:uncharacterized protein YjcR